MDRGAWWATVHGVAKSWTQQVTEHAREACLTLLCSQTLHCCYYLSAESLI